MTQFDITAELAALDSIDCINVADVIDRVEKLEDQCDGIGEDLCLELIALETTLDDLKGKGADIRWRGNWYPAYWVL